MAINFLNNPKVGDNVKIEIGTGSDLQIYHDGSNSFITNSTGDLTVGSILIDTVGNVGIGLTPASTVLLDLKEADSTADLIIGLTSGTGARAQIRSIKQVNNTSSELSFYTTTSSSTSERMRIKSTGQVQFNAYGQEDFTGTAAYLLAVESDGDIIEVGASDLPGGPYLPLAGGTLTGALKILVAADPKLILQSTSTDSSDWNYINFVGRDSVRDSYVGTDSGGDMYFYSDKNTSSVALTSSGIILNGDNVGIGTTSPDLKLDVESADTTVFSGTGYRTALFQSTSAVNTDKPGITLGYDTTGGGIIAPATQSGTTNFLGFWTYNSGWGERMRLDIAGNLGIGTTTASSKLTVQDNSYQVMLVDTSTSNRGEISVEDAAFGFYADRAASTADSSFFWSIDNLNKMEINLTGGGEGQLRLNDYGPGNITGTVEFILGVDANGNVIETSAGGSGTVTGTGAATRVAFWSGTTALSSDANLYWDNTNDRLGIGTTSPGALLEIFGTGNTLRLDSAANGSKEILFRNVGTGIATIKTDGDLKLYAEDANKNILFETNGGEAMRITSAGNVGIGVTSAASRLTVEGSTSSNIVASKISLNGAQSWGNVLMLATRAGTDNARLLFSSRNGAKQWSTGGHGLANDNGYSIAENGGDVNTGSSFGTPRLYIEAGGNVGIGTTSPSNKLTVNQGGGVRVTGITNGTYIELSGDLPGYSANQYPVIKSGGSIHFANNGKYGAYLEGSDTYFGLVDSAIATKVLIKTSGNSYFNGGNVGIGTTSPSAKAVISNGGALGYEIDPASASGEVLSLFSYNRSTSAWKTTRYSALDHRFETNGTTERMRIDSAGTVQVINSSIPTIQLYNTDTSLGIAQTLGDIDFYQSDPSGGGVGVVSKIRSINDSSFQGEAGLSFHTGTTTGLAERMRIDSAGDVLIGQTSFGTGLSGFAQLEVSNATAGGIVINTQTASTSNYSRLMFTKGNAAGNEGVIRYNTGDYHMSFWTNAQEKMRITSAGNVGIGTTAPTYGKLVLSSTIASTSDYNWLVFNNAQSGYGDWNIHKSGSNDLAFASGVSAGDSYTNRLVLEYDGNVGIGTTSPDAKLDIEKPAAGTTFVPYLQLSQTDTASNTKYGILFKNTQYGWDQGRISVERQSSASNFDLILSSSSAGSLVEGIRIDHSGNVGIGTTDPGEKLEVVGNSITRSKTRGIGTNYATPEGWVESSAVASATGFFGGNFAANGGSSENKVEYDIGPFGSRELVWMSIPETGNNDDGGWNKGMDGFSNSSNNGFMSVIYVRRDSGTPSGTFYHGCSASATNNLGGSANTNPYFSVLGIASLPTDVWCVAIGIIYANNDSNAVTSNLGGIYRLDTGQKISAATTFRQKASNATQVQRVYHYYSTSPTAQLDFAKPGFYIVDGSEPSLSELLNGGATDDAFWSASGNDIYNDNSGNVGIGTTSPASKLHIYQNSTDTSSGAGITIEQDGTGDAVVQYLLSSTRRWTAGVDNSDSDRFKISSSADVGTDTVLTINTSEAGGSVGIGTTAPGSLLHLRGSGTTSVMKMSAASNEANYGYLTMTDNTVNTAKLTFGTTYGYNTQVDAMTIFNGKVGITTATPGYALDVNNSARLGASGNGSNPPHKTIISGQSISSDGVNYYGSYGFLELNATSNWTGGARRFAITNALDATKFAIIRSDSNMATMQMGASGAVPTGAVADFVITNTGTVGIGTSSPSGQLDVSGDIWVNGDNVDSARYLRINRGGTSDGGILLYGNGSLDWQLVNNSSTRDLLFYSYAASSTVVRIQASTGNVGIGTTNPTAKLTVVDNSNILSFNEHGSSAVAELKIIGAQAHDTAIYFGDSVDNVRAGFYYDVSSNQLQVRGYNNSTKIAVTSAGRVGIGTTNPGGTLDVDAPSTTANSLTYGAAAGQIFTNENSEFAFGLLNASPYPLYIQGRTSSNTARNITLQGLGGNIGIGTYTPSVKLHVASSNSEMLRLQSTSATGSPLISFFQTSTRRSYI